MDRIIRAIASLWLFKGLKYKVSRFIHRREWYEPISGLNLAGCKHPVEVVERIRGHAWYERDRLWSLWDTVRPPMCVLRRAARRRGKGEDCDGMAMLHARAIKQALPDWEVFIVSALARPFRLSHHFAIARDPESGWWWVIQPQPKVDSPNPGRGAYGGYKTIEEGLRAVELSYAADGMERYLAWDIRDPDWIPIEKKEH